MRGTSTKDYEDDRSVIPEDEQVQDIAEKIC